MGVIEKINAKEARCAVIGLGYVGLPLLVELADAGFEAVGIDLDENKIKSIMKGVSYIGDVPTEDVKRLVKSGKLSATTDYSVLKKCDTVNICVPTPLRKTRDPDISYIVNSCEQIAKYLHKGMLVTLESTTYPGTTEEVMLVKFAESGLKVGLDFFLAFSPERVDPSNPKFQTRNIPKVVGGVTPNCTKAAVALYSQVMDTVVPVSNARVAETVKLLENTFRSVNIGLVNEMALMCDKMDINVWEVIDAAATKPFGFMPFYPGPGLGGHCIPIDPLYLSWKARAFGFEARFIELAAQVNAHMPEHVVSKTIIALNKKKIAVNGANLLILGVAYKKNVADVRESPALEIIESFKRQGAKVQYNDPYIPQIRMPDGLMKSVGLTKAVLNKQDIVVVITDHTDYDYRFVSEHASLLMDTRNALKGIKGALRKKIVSL